VVQRAIGENWKAPVTNGNPFEELIRMETPQTNDPSRRFEVKVTSDSHFSWLRTRWSLERTLMSWVRTAVSLIGFGFTIVQFFERFQDMTGVAHALRPQAPRYLGLALIFAGITALVIAAWEYRQLLRYLWSENFAVLAGVDQKPHRTPIFAVTILVMLIGIFAFFAVLLRLA
jgi:putative membrane protein